MSGELHQNTETVINLHIMMRDYICREICSGKKNCDNLICIESILRIAGQIEIETEGIHGHKKTDI